MASFRQLPVYGSSLSHVLKSPDDSSLFALSANQTIYRSLDNGDTWKEYYGSLNKINDMILMSDEDANRSVLLYIERGVVYRTFLSEKLMTPTLTLPCRGKSGECTYRFINHASPDMLYVEVFNEATPLENRVYFSKNMGETWQIKERVSKSNIAIAKSGETWWSDLYKSRDEGETWSLISSKIPSFSKGKVKKILPISADEDSIFIWLDRIYSYQLGGKLVDIGMMEAVHDFIADPKGKLWILSTTGKLYSYDNGNDSHPVLRVENWTATNMDRLKLSMDGEHIWVGDHRLLIDESLEQKNVGIKEIDLIHYTCLSERCENLLVASKSQIFRSQNQGVDWELVYTANRNEKIIDLEGHQTGALALVGQGSIQRIVASGNGSSWQETSLLENVEIVENGLVQKVISPKGKNGFSQPDPSLILVKEDTAQITMDEGKTWKSIVMPDSGKIQFLRFHPLNSGELYIGTLGEDREDETIGGVYTSLDLGETWTRNDLLSYQSACQIYFHQYNADIFFLLARKKNGPISSCFGDLIMTQDRGDRWKKTAIKDQIKIVSSSIQYRDDFFLTTTDNRIIVLPSTMNMAQHLNNRLSYNFTINYFIPNVKIAGSDNGLKLLVREDAVVEPMDLSSLILEEKVEENSAIVPEEKTVEPSAKEKNIPSVNTFGCQIGSPVSGSILFLFLLLPLLLKLLQKVIKHEDER